MTLDHEHGAAAVNIEMIPQSVITGRVINSGGEPVEGASVVVISALSKLPIQGTTTNDIGEFRIAKLDPGDYFLRAAGGDEGVDGTPIQTAEVPSIGKQAQPEQVQAPTFYGNVPDLESAIPLRLQAGVEQRDVEIQLRRSVAFEIQGVVLDDTSGRSAEGARVGISPANNSGVLSVFMLGGTRLPNGRFEIHRVLPGTYELLASIRRGPVRYSRQMLTVEQDMNNLTVHVPGSVAISGHVRLVSGEEKPNNSGIDLRNARIKLLPANGFVIGDLAEVRPHADGSFIFEPVSPDNYQVRVSDLPPGYYLKAVEINHRTAGSWNIDITANTQLDLAISPGAGQISGKVVGENGLPSPRATVIALPAGGAGNVRCLDCYSALADEMGNFKLQDVIPGSYRLFGVDQCSYGRLHGVDPSLVPPPDNAATLDIAEGSTKTLDIKLIAIPGG